MQKNDISGMGRLELEHLVCDFTGTLSVDGRLLPGVGDLLHQLAASMTIHVVTADTFGRAEVELAGCPCTVTVLHGQGLDVQKEQYVKGLGQEQVVAIGNGNNDRLMLKAARIGIAVVEEEGCAIAALMSADVLALNIHDAFNLLLQPDRLKATLRF